MKNPAEAARDPLGAFFYVRTLAWRERRSARIPVNDAGKNLVLTVEAAGEETIAFSGRTAPALRLECTVEQRIQRRRPVAFTVWLSVDQRRMPLAASMDAGFGRFRLELVTP